MPTRGWLHQWGSGAGGYKGVFRVIWQLLLIVLLLLAVVSGAVLVVAPPKTYLTPPLSHYGVFIDSDTRQPPADAGLQGDGVWLMLHTRGDKTGGLRWHSPPGLVRHPQDLHVHRVTLPGFFFHWKVVRSQLWWEKLRCSGGVNLMVPIMLAAMMMLVEVLRQKHRARVMAQQPIGLVIT